MRENLHLRWSRDARAWSGGRRVNCAFLALCVLACFRPMVTTREPVDPPAVVGFPGWAMLPGFERLTPLALGPREARFAQQFPGKIGAFACDRSTWIVRWMAQPTRKLHPAADCLKATGYDVHPEPIFASDDGKRWGAITASRDGEKLIVRERIVDSRGQEFTDVSAWFWMATLDKSEGPWWCFTRIESARSRQGPK